MDIKTAKKIMGKNFIGPNELRSIADKINISGDLNSNEILDIPFSEKELKKISQSHLLILGVQRNATGQKLTLNSLRDFFGVNPEIKEPCFYNQDWYFKEKFAEQTVLKNKWYLIGKEVDKNTRGKSPETMKGAAFPPAILTAFIFFAYYFHTDGKILWQQDFIWCSDKDNNGDRIYTGRYIDPDRINKNGFNIHRHLSIRQCYGLAPMI